MCNSNERYANSNGSGDYSRDQNGRAEGVGLGGSNPRLEHQYPANPQYQYPYPYNEPQAKHDRKCPRGHVLYRGRCAVPRPVALPF